MKKEEMLDVIHELIAVDTEEGFIIESVTKDDCIVFKTNEGENFKVCVEKIK